MFHVELIYADRTEVFRWPDRHQAEALAEYYGRECKGDKGFVAARVREAGGRRVPVPLAIKALFRGDRLGK